MPTALGYRVDGKAGVAGMPCPGKSWAEAPAMVAPRHDNAGPFGFLRPAACGGRVRAEVPSLRSGMVPGREHW